MNQRNAEITVGINKYPYHSAEIFIDGMGTFSSTDDSPIYLEFYEDEDGGGKWMLHIWSDINQENPTHQIDMSAAFESNRKV